MTSHSEYLEAVEAESQRKAALLIAAADVDNALLTLQRTGLAFIRLGGRGDTLATCTKARLTETHGLVAAALAVNRHPDFEALRGVTVRTLTQNRLDAESRHFN